MNLGETQPSSWKNYPERYQFISLQIQVEPTIKITEQKNYSLVRLFSELGGIMKGVTLLGSILTKMFMDHRFTALYASRMFTYSDVTNFEVDVKEPQCYVIYNCISKLGCSRLFKRTKWGAYSQTLKKINYDIENNLDIVSIVRRLKFHGFAISYLIKNKNVTKTLVKLAKN